MPYVMKDLRLAKYSIMYFLVSGLSSRGWLNIFPTLTSRIRDDFPDDPKFITDFPTIAVKHDLSSILPYQLGAGKEDVRKIHIVIYSDSDGLRDDISSDIGDIFYETKADLKDYNSGFPPPFGSASEPTISGYISFENIRLVPNTIKLKELKATRHIMDIYFNAKICYDN